MRRPSAIRSRRRVVESLSVARSWLVDRQHQLPSGMAGHSTFECLSGLRQRDRLRGHRADCAGIDQRREPAELFAIGSDDEEHAALAALAVRRCLVLGDGSGKLTRMPPGFNTCQDRSRVPPPMVSSTTSTSRHLDHPIIAITRAYQCAGNDWNFDPQGIERSSDAGGMDSLDTCNPCFQLNHVWGFQLRSIAHISDSGADLQRQCELGDVDVTIDITLTLANVGGEVVVFLHLNGRTPRLTNCTSEHVLMFLVIGTVLQAKLEHGFAHFCLAHFDGREAISPNTPILKEECSI